MAARDTETRLAAATAYVAARDALSDVALLTGQLALRPGATRQVPWYLTDGTVPLDVAETPAQREARMAATERELATLALQFPNNVRVN